MLRYPPTTANSQLDVVDVTADRAYIVEREAPELALSERADLNIQVFHRPSIRNRRALGAACPPNERRNVSWEGKKWG
jgi:hypothetical protein